MEDLRKKFPAKPLQSKKKNPATRMAMKKIHAQIARQKKLLLFTRNNRG